MTFVYNSNNDVESYAEFEDVLDTDQRVFYTNEGLSDSVIYPLLVKSTERIIDKIMMSDWYSKNNLTSFDSTLIIAKQQYFTDLCVYYALAEFILPNIADFGNQDTAEYQKMQYYNNKFNILFNDLLSSTDWYDGDNDGNPDPSVTTFYNRRRVR